MTVDEWLASRTPRPPSALVARVHAVLVPAGEGGVEGVPPTHAPEVYLEAAERLLGRLLDEGRATRESALDLLVADALVTYAFEAAGDDPTRLERLAATATRRIAALAGDPAEGDAAGEADEGGRGDGDAR